MVWDKLDIIGKGFIEGRGTFLQLNVDLIGFVKSEWIKNIEISVGDTVTYNGGDFRVKELLALSRIDLSDDTVVDKLGLIVNKI